MKLNKFTHLLVIGLVLAVAASGCRKKPVNTTLLPGQHAGKPGDADRGGAIRPAEPLVSIPGPVNNTPPGEGIPSNSADRFKDWIPDASILKADTVYFAFDSSAIRASENSKIAAVADYVKANKGKAVRVEGNCDERGTEEYNRSLGERRALAVREELVRLGVSPDFIDTISYGKDKPAAQGHDESAWRENRRDDFVVLSPPNK